MKYQKGIYQTTEGRIRITRISTSESSSVPYYIIFLSQSNQSMGWVAEDYLDLIIIQEKPTTPEPLENWKHPYYGKPILVRDSEDEEWQEEIFESYLPYVEKPVVVKYGSGYRLYKFPEPLIQMTTAELLALAKEVKGVEVELKEEE